MRSTKASGVPAGIAVVAALLVLAPAQDAGSGRATLAAVEAPMPPAATVSEAEARIARTNLAGVVEAALGEAFGGAWFDPSTARLHVAVATPAARPAGEVAADRVGLAGMVTWSAVGMSWQELESAQHEWNRRVFDLLERGEATTWLDPETNSVKVELASSVPAARVANLEREATAAGHITILASPRAAFSGGKAAEQCNEWKKFEAYCDPTIVGGVTLHGEKAMPRAECTTGPAVRLKDRSTTENATKTYILTAGHCLDKGGGVGKSWFAYNKAGEEKEIGPAGSFINGKIDIGVVEVKTNNWKKANDPVPVVPATALWLKGFETNPTTVLSEGSATEGTKTCLIGQRSGEVCGPIVNKSTTTELDGQVVEKLVRVDLAAGKGGRGDSGGTMRSEASASTVEGVYIGFTFENEESGTEGKVIYFHSLKTAFEELKAQKNLELELLKSANSKRVHPKATTAKYPATVSGTDNSSAERFTAFGSAIECSERKLEGSLTEASGTLELTPTYGGCALSGLWPAKVSTNGCEYRLTFEGEVAAGHYDANVDVICPEGKSGIELYVYLTHADLTAAKPMCTLTVPPQTGLEKATLTNSGEGVLIDSSTVAGLDVKVQSSNCVCPGDSAEAETSNGVLDLDGGLTLSATSLGEAVKLDIGGE